MTRLLLLGAGKIGRMITSFLSATHDFEITVADSHQQSLDILSSRYDVKTKRIDACDASSLHGAMTGHDVVVSALSFSFNPVVAQVALDTGASYFDLSEDIETTRNVRRVAASAKPGQIFMPQCGLAPGFVSIVGHHLTGGFRRLDVLRMRVGALPQFPTNSLKYNLTWSTDGLINEYCNPCEAIHEGRKIELLSLEGLEHFSLDGVRYEAFNTSGGLGTLCETLNGSVRELNYKTIRYPGHCDLMKVLVQELRLSERRGLLKDILENAIPITFQDVVIVFCTIAGDRDGELVQVSDARKIYGQTVNGEDWSAIQITTAAGICTVVDLFLAGQLPKQGFVRQEDVPFGAFIENRFGRFYESGVRASFGA